MHNLISVFLRKNKAAAMIGAALLLPCGTSMGSALLGLQVEASTTGQPGTYSSTLASAPAPGSTLFFEVVAQSASSGTTNSNTIKSPNGTTDSIVSVPYVILTATSGTNFAASALQNNFGTGSGATGGTPGSNTIEFRAIEQGFTENDDNALVVDSGTLTVGSSFAGITAQTDKSAGSTGIGTNAGSLRVAGSPLSVTATTEGSSDPILGYTGMAVNTSPVPEPVTYGLFMAAAPALLLRRRRQV